MKRASKRFKPSRLSERLVPILLVILLIGLSATLLIVVLSMLGIIPS